MSDTVPDTMGYAWLDLTREERMVAYMALKATGKQKGSDLQLAVALRTALLDDCLVDEESGRVTWRKGTVIVPTVKHFEMLRKAVSKLADDGVDIDLGEAMIGLEAKIDSIVAEKKATVAVKKE